MPKDVIRDPAPLDCDPLDELRELVAVPAEYNPFVGGRASTNRHDDRVVGKKVFFGRRKSASILTFPIYEVGG
jgi:hypothetical protein